MIEQTLKIKQIVQKNEEKSKKLKLYYTLRKTERRNFL